MQTEDSIKITNRFFTILHHLIKLKVLRGKGAFARQYGVSQPNLRKLERNPASDIFQSAWLYYLVRDFNVNPEWLLTGKGKRFTVEPKPLKKFIYKKRVKLLPGP